MTHTFEGHLGGEGLKIGIVVGRFNDLITMRLLDGAKDALKRHGVNEQDVALAFVPGAYELPLIAKKMAQSGKYDAIITLGAVIRGATPHFDYVCNEAAKGIAQASYQTEVPVIFGVFDDGGRLNRRLNGPGRKPEQRLGSSDICHRDGEFIETILRSGPTRTRRSFCVQCVPIRASSFKIEKSSDEYGKPITCKGADSHDPID